MVDDRPDGCGFAPAPADLDLSTRHLSIYTVDLPVYADLFAVCHRGIKETWIICRIVSDRQTPYSL